MAAAALAGYEVEIRKGRRRYRKETKVSFHERDCGSGLTGEEGKKRLRSRRLKKEDGRKEEKKKRMLEMGGGGVKAWDGEEEDGIRKRREGARATLLGFFF